MRKFMKLHKGLGRYLLISPLLLIPIFLAFNSRSVRPLVLFVVFAVAGIVGEALFEAWWNFFFRKPFLVYKFHPLFNGYSSALNLILWGFAGMLYTGLLWFFGTSVYIVEFGTVSAASLPFYIIFYLYLIIGIVIQFGIWLALKRQKKYQSVNAWSYLLFAFPTLLSLAACTLVYGKKMIVVAVIFAFVTGWVEYMLGKIFEYFFGQTYWTSNYGTLEDSPYALLSMVPFALAGFYFWSIALIFAAIFP